MFGSKKGKTVWMIDVDSISRNPSQARRCFDRRELEGMAESIRKNGILQPLIVRKINGGYELIAGERRLRASKIANLDTVPCIIANVDERRSSLLSLLENLQRSDLNCFEEAEGLRRLIDTWGVTQNEAAERLGKSQSAIANKMRLLKLSPAEQNRILQAGLSERHARALLKIEDRTKRIAAIKHIIKSKCTVEQTEKYVDSLLYEKPEKEELKRPYAVRDLRLFINTVSHAVETMKKSGIAAACEKYETDEFIEYKVKIAK
ncbi:MAG: ParB/RepB/Spo0J family partition protein [Acutalibacteraceae bacterium]